VKQGRRVLASRARGVDDQRHAVERARQADQAFSGGVGQQLRRGGRGRDPRRGPRRTVAGVAQTGGFALGFVRRRRQPLQDAGDRLDVPPLTRPGEPAEVQRHRPPGRDRRDQSVHGGLKNARTVPEIGGFADCGVDQRVKRDRPPHHLAPRRAGRRLQGVGRRDGSREARQRVCRDGRKLPSEPSPGAAKVGEGEHDAGADDPHCDLDHPDQGQQENLLVRAAGRAEHVAGDDGGGEAGEPRAIGGEILEQRADKTAGGAPQRQPRQKTDPVLREQGGDDDDRDPADCGSDQPERGLAHRSAKLGLADQRSRRPCPGRIAELQGEGDIEGEANRGP
jgi:hypothetical protein